MPTRLVIIGGGPAGNTAATHAARFGAEVTLIERDVIGGAAHLWDCIPSKTMIATGGAMSFTRRIRGMGLERQEVEVDIETGHVKVTRVLVNHDCGNVINPMVVDGQVIGGAVHGLGNALVAGGVGVHGLVVQRGPAFHAGVGAGLHPAAEVQRGHAVVGGQPQLFVERVTRLCGGLSEIDPHRVAIRAISSSSRAYLSANLLCFSASSSTSPGPLPAGLAASGFAASGFAASGLAASGFASAGLATAGVPAGLASAGFASVGLAPSSRSTSAAAATTSEVDREWNSR